MPTCKQCHYEEKAKCRRFPPKDEYGYPPIEDIACGEFKQKIHRYNKQDHIPEKPAVDITKGE